MYCFYSKFSVDNDIDVSKFCEIYSDFYNCKCDTISAKATATPFSQNCTGKFFSEALILASTNPQYDQRLFIELP